MADSPLFKKLKERAREVGSRAVHDLMQSDSRADLLGSAVRTAQSGKRVLDAQGSRVAGALGLATQDDLARLERKIGRLRKRLTALVDRFE